MAILLCRDIKLEQLENLFSRYQLTLKNVSPNTQIPGSFWQAPEAGLVDDMLYLRDDTPVHSALHEACHFICMDDTRRDNLNTDAGGDYEEENAVCYLQIILSDFITEMGRERMFSDMDAWGYSFRLGSSVAWFEHDAEDAENWLLNHEILQKNLEPSWNRRRM